MSFGLFGLFLQSADFQTDARLIGTLPPEFAVDADGTSVGQGFVLDSRIRSSLQLDKEEWRLVAQGDLLTGQILGDAWDLEGTVHRRNLERVGVLGSELFLPRKAYLETDIWKLNILAGITTNHWGLGMFINDGEQTSWFGRSDYGDRVFRIQANSKLNPKMTFSINNDVILEDEWASFALGQRAVQSSGVLVFYPEPGQEFGFLFTLRWQSEEDIEQKTNGYLADFYGKQETSIQGYRLGIEYEAAMIQGDTERFSNSRYPNGLGTISQGLAGEVFLYAPEDRWGVWTRLAVGTGDGNVNDGTIREFSFDRDFNAGMLLFDYYQSAIEVELYNQLTDPTLSAYPPKGVDAVVTEGAIRATSFIQPVVFACPTPWMKVKMGAVFSWSMSPIAQSFYTERNGGVPTNHLGIETTERYLGTEVNWGVALDVNHWVQDTVDLDLEMQGGHVWTSEQYGTNDVLSMIALQSNIRF